MVQYGLNSVTSWYPFCWNPASRCIPHLVPCQSGLWKLEKPAPLRGRDCFRHPLSSTAYEEASSELEGDPEGETGQVIPAIRSVVAKAPVPPPPPPPVPHSGDHGSTEASTAKAAPIAATASVGPKPGPHAVPLRSGPPIPSPATPVNDFLATSGTSEGVHIFVPGPKISSPFANSWRYTITVQVDPVPPKASPRVKAATP